MKTKNLVFCALFAALTAVLSQIAIPIGPVPITLSHISIFIAAGVLGAKYATVSMLIYVLLGVVGAPVFSNFKAGAGVLVGPTGGFIVGYIACAFVTGLLIEQYYAKMSSALLRYGCLLLAILAGWAVTYACGLSWFVYSTNTDIAAAMSVCFYPFIPGDILKSIVSVAAIIKLKPLYESN